MTVVNALLPEEANNDYRGGAIPLYGFGLLTAVMLGRSLIHFLKDDSGVNSIATIITFSGTPDPNNVIYMFSSLWGTQQLITVIVYGVVLLRYRSLIPAMYLLQIAEVFFRISVGILHPLTEEFFLRTPPGKIGNVPLLLFCGGMLYLTIRKPAMEAAAASR